MEILNKKNLKEIVKALKQGKILVFPTETSYGLGCDATNQESVEKIFEIKKRIKEKPLLVVAGSVKTAKKYLKWSEILENLSKKYWKDDKSALTIISKYKKSLFKKRLVKGVVSFDNTLALRVTKDLWLKELCEKFGLPIVATSANLAGEDNIYSFVKIKEIFKEKDVIIINGGDLEEKVASTLVSVVNNKLEILRQGEISIK